MKTTGSVYGLLAKLKTMGIQGKSGLAMSIAQRILMLHQASLLSLRFNRVWAIIIASLALQLFKLIKPL